MINLSYSEENYLKAIYHLAVNGNGKVTTNSISEKLLTKPASVSDMIRKLSDKGVINYKKYQGVHLTRLGKQMALKVIRKHRLWEVFLVEKLNFNWDEVHEVAEQLEHIKSPLLIKRLDEFLKFPKYDPHGDPIPDENGDFAESQPIELNEMGEGNSGILVTIKDTSAPFLKYLDKLSIHPGVKIKVVEKIEYDGSMQIELSKGKVMHISKEVSGNLLVTEEL